MLDGLAVLFAQFSHSGHRGALIKVKGEALGHPRRKGFLEAHYRCLSISQ